MMRLATFILKFCVEMVWAIGFVFLCLIPIMYMGAQLDKEPELFVSALARIMVAITRNNPISSDTYFQAVWLGISISIGFMVVACRLIMAPFEAKGSPNQERLYGYIDAINGLRRRDAFCKALLDISQRVQEMIDTAHEEAHG